MGKDPTTFMPWSSFHRFAYSSGRSAACRKVSNALCFSARSFIGPILLFFGYSASAILPLFGLPGYDKLVYVDSDMMILENIDELFDRPHLSEALVNLIKNGLRFTPDGGHVEVRAVREGEELVISVRDTGIGIEPGRLIDLLERPFAARDANHHHSSRQLEFNSRGFGLGLPIARGIVEAHGGKLSVESSVGNGSTFTIRLPAPPAIGLKRAA